jgi:[ribosomal protein S18]-alanine N-acetyltransferase
MSAPKAKLIDRIETAYRNGKGVRLSHEDVGLLMSVPDADCDISPEHQQDRVSLDVQVRWLIRRDMPEVLTIENASSEFPWSEEDFLTTLRQRNCIGMVAEHDHDIVGFMIYELHKGRLGLLNMAVASHVCRCGIGRQMIERLKDKLSQQRRTEIQAEVRERNLPAQLFFRKQGFHVSSVLREHYDDTEEDAYLMRYRVSEKARKE